MLCLNAIQTVAVNAVAGTAIQQFSAILKEKLCRPVCKDQEIQPMPMLKYSLEDQRTVGTTTFVDLVVNGKIEYVPKGCKPCQVMTKRIYERTTLAFTNPSATNPSPVISLSQGISDGSLSDTECGIAKGYQVATDLTVTAVYA